MTHDVDEAGKMISAANPVSRDMYAGAASDPAGLALFERIVTTESTAWRDRTVFRRRWTLAIAGTLITATTFTTAEAAGIVPTGVIHAFGGMRDTNGPIGQVDTGKASMTARLRTPEGDIVQWWEAPNKGGGTCWYLRELPAGGGKEDGSMECDVAEGTPQPPPILIRVDQSRHGQPHDRWYIYGRVSVPGAVTIRMTFDDHPAHDFAVQPNGRFLTMVPWASDHQPLPNSVVALDHNGRIVSRG